MFIIQCVFYIRSSLTYIRPRRDCLVFIKLDLFVDFVIIYLNYVAPFPTYALAINPILPYYRYMWPSFIQHCIRDRYDSPRDHEMNQLALNLNILSAGHSYQQGLAPWYYFLYGTFTELNYIQLPIRLSATIWEFPESRTCDHTMLRKAVVDMPQW